MKISPYTIYLEMQPNALLVRQNFIICKKWVLQSELPRLFSYARDRKISVAHFYNNSNVHENFCTQISNRAAHELITLNQIIIQAQVNNHNRDK
jgi:hypothetical protein